mgnify:FL=1
MDVKNVKNALRKEKYMNKTNKLLSLLLVLTIVFSLSVTALAADTTYTITVDGSGTVANHTFEAYQIFSGDLHTPETAEGGTASKILSNIVWGTGVDTSKDGFDAAFPESAAATAEKLTTVAQAQDFAKKIEPYLSATHKDASDKNGAGNYVISGLPAGYYLVKDKDDTLTGANDFYTAYLMKVVADVRATPKGEKPTLEKQIQNNNTGEWSTTGNVAFQLGDTVKFRIITSVPDISRYPNGYTYKIYDTMTQGLTSNVKSADDFTIEVKNDPGNKLESKYYSVETSQITVDDKLVDHFVLTIDVKQAIADGRIAAGSELFIIYTAILNDKADFYQIGEHRNSNTAYLEYSNNPNGAGTGKTPESKVNAWTFPASISKVDGKDSKKILEGAKFVLSRNPNLKVSDMKCDENGVPTVPTDLIPLFAPGDQHTSTAAYDIATAEQVDAGTNITYVIELGSKVLAGFGEHAYYLYETKAPNGYNLLSEPVKFTFHSSATNDFVAGDPAWITLNDSAIKLTGMQFEIANNSGATLPETGGIGTTLFYVIGALLVVGAGVLLVTKKRMGKADN